MSGRRARQVRRAVALSYRPRRDEAPRVVASGQGRLAERIIAAAREAGVPLHEDPELVELLSRLDLNEVIPPELYAVVAQVLAFVYQADRERADQGRGRR